MIVLDTTTRSLEIVLAGSVTTNQLPLVAAFVDFSDGHTPGASQTQTNNTTAVTAVAAPAAGTQRQVKFLSLRNSDTAAATATLRFNDNATLRTIVTVVLTSGDVLLYTDGEGFRVLDSNGNLKGNTNGLNNPVALTQGGTGQTSATAGFNALGPATTKGDLIVHNGTDHVRLAVGSNNQILTADSAQASGVKWVTGSTVAAATQAEMEAFTATNVYASPGRTHNHPGVAKGWVEFDGTGSTTVGASYNVASVTDNGTGDWTVNWTTSFSSANYAVVTGVRRDTASQNALVLIKSVASNPVAGSVTIKAVNISVTAIDCEFVSVAAFGDQ